MKVDLDLASNLFGMLGDDIRKRLTAAIDNPCEQTWDDVRGIILNRKPMMTLWQAIIAIDPTFPRRGPAEDIAGNRLSSWARIPDRDTIIQAINYATH